MLSCLYWREGEEEACLFAGRRGRERGWAQPGKHLPLCLVTSSVDMLSTLRGLLYGTWKQLFLEEALCWLSLRSERREERGRERLCRAASMEGILPLTWHFLLAAASLSTKRAGGTSCATWEAFSSTHVSNLCVYDSVCKQQGSASLLYLHDPPTIYILGTLPLSITPIMPCTNMEERPLLKDI